MKWKPLFILRQIVENSMGLFVDSSVPPNSHAGAAVRDLGRPPAPYLNHIRLLQEIVISTEYQTTEQ